jgi:hypothetical protein
MDLAGQQFKACFGLAGQPVIYQLDLHLAHCSSKLYREQAGAVQTGQPARLRFCSSKKQVTVLVQGKPVGRLYAADAAHLLLLFNFYQRLPGWLDKPFYQQDRSLISFVQKKQLYPEDKGRRFPKLGICLRLVLPQAWPVFVIQTVLKTRDDTCAVAGLVSANPWLAPLLALQQDYRRLGHDGFILPELITSSWLWLTGQAAEL